MINDDVILVERVLFVCLGVVVWCIIVDGIWLYGVISVFNISYDFGIGMFYVVLVVFGVLVFLVEVFLVLILY